MASSLRTLLSRFGVVEWGLAQDIDAYICSMRNYRAWFPKLCGVEGMGNP